MAKSAGAAMSPGPWYFPAFLVRNFTGKPSSDCLVVRLTFFTILRTADRVVLPWPALQARWIAVALTQVAVYDGRPKVSGLPPCAFWYAFSVELPKSTGKPET